MVMTSKDTRKLLNITKRVLTEQTAPNWPETLAGSINKQYGTGLKQKYSQDQLIKMIYETYVQFMVTIGVDAVKAQKKASNAINHDEDFVPDVLSSLK
jgi:hypothetical protein